MIHGHGATRSLLWHTPGRLTINLIVAQAALAGHSAYPASIDRFLGMTARFHIEHFNAGSPGWVQHRGVTLKASLPVVHECFARDASIPLADYAR